MVVTEPIQWKVVPRYFKGGSGDDIIKGGKAGFDEMGVPGQDIAIILAKALIRLIL